MRQTSPLTWMQIFADVTGIPVETVAGAELTGLGGAMAMTVMTGRYNDLATASAAMSRVTHRYEPNIQQTTRYQEKYAVYQDIALALNGHWARFAKEMGGAK